jgi:hypothetical protein
MSMRGSNRSRVDGLVKNLKTSFYVFPAKAGIQCFQIVLDACLRRACPCEGRGMTEFRTFYEFVIIRYSLFQSFFFN